MPLNEEKQGVVAPLNHERRWWGWTCLNVRKFYSWRRNNDIMPSTTLYWSHVSSWTTPIQWVGCANGKASPCMKKKKKGKPFWTVSEGASSPLSSTKKSWVTQRDVKSMRVPRVSFLHTHSYYTISFIKGKSKQERTQGEGPLEWSSHAEDDRAVAEADDIAAAAKDPEKKTVTAGKRDCSDASCLPLLYLDLLLPLQEDPAFEWPMVLPKLNAI